MVVMMMIIMTTVIVHIQQTIRSMNVEQVQQKASL
jgi:hypothetical protein